MDSNEITEYLFIREVLDGLGAIDQQTRMSLQRSPGNFKLMSALEKVKHDRELLFPIFQEKMTKLLTELEKETGGKFKYLLAQEEVNGKMKVQK